MLEVSLLPTITREPAAFPRHWPCLGGRFREFWGLFHTVRMTWAGMVLVQFQRVPTPQFTFTNILFHRKKSVSLYLNSWADAENLLESPSQTLTRNILLWDLWLLSPCWKQTASLLKSQITTPHVLLLCPGGKTLKGSTCLLDVSHSLCVVPPCLM